MGNSGGAPGLRVALVVVSDRSSRGERPDGTGPRLAEALRGKGVEVSELVILPDERKEIAAALIRLCDVASVILTAGGTGLGPRDVTPEATASVIERPVPGMAEAMRAAGLRTTPHAMLSRGTVGVRGRCLIINLPGSPKGAVESLEAVWEAVPHAVALLQETAAERSHSHREGAGGDS